MCGGEAGVVRQQSTQTAAVKGRFHQDAVIVILIPDCPDQQVRPQTYHSKVPRVKKQNKTHELFCISICKVPCKLTELVLTRGMQ